MELIFVPLLGVGHLVSSIEFAKKLISHHNDQISITILVIKLPVTPFVDAYPKALVSSQPNINLIYLPQADVPPLESAEKSFERYLYCVIECYKPHVKSVVADIMFSRSKNSGSIQVAGLVIDIFCTPLIEIGDDFGLPSFIFYTSGAHVLSLLLHLPSRHEKVGAEFKFSDADVLIPGFVNHVPPTVLPDALFNEDGGYAFMLKISQQVKKAKGFIVNTFTELESHAVEYLKNNITTKVYPIGPMLYHKGHPHPDMDDAQWNTIIKWLDEQPESSVVYLCFGSSGYLSVSQVKEMALALELSGHKFLWALRFSPMQKGGTQFTTPDDMLPEGFLERIEGRGVVCRWTQQVEVLSHKAIGGFVSHCGWNSVLESLWFGVPIVTLPLYAEQQLNAFIMVRELGLAVDLKMDYRPNSDVVSAEEVKSALTCLMESDSEVRKEVKDVSGLARKAEKEGGSSFNSISEFIKDLQGSRN